MSRRTSSPGPSPSISAADETTDASADSPDLDLDETLSSDRELSRWIHFCLRLAAASRAADDGAVARDGRGLQGRLRVEAEAPVRVREQRAPRVAVGLAREDAVVLGGEVLLVLLLLGHGCRASNAGAARPRSMRAAGWRSSLASAFLAGQLF